MPANDTRNKICEAAIRTASRDGILAMTLDNVAKEAGVSKGGVMYHFASKEELVRGTLEYFADLLEQMVLQKVADDPNPRFRWARTMLSCNFPDQPPDGNGDGSPLPPELIDRFMLAALATAINSPGLIEPLRQVGLRMQRRFLSDPDQGLEQLLIWLALDGLFLWQFVGLIQQDQPLYEQIKAILTAKVTAAANHQSAASQRNGEAQA